MDNIPLYIIKHISIKPRFISIDGRVIVDQKDTVDFGSFSRELYKSLKCNYSKFYKMDNLCKLAFLAAELLMRDVNFSLIPEKTALLLGNSNSTIDTDTKFVNTIDKIPSPAIFVYTLPNIAAGELSIRHGWKGENLFLVSDNFEPEIFTENLQMLFNDSNTEACVTGWIEYLTKKNYKASLWLITSHHDQNCKLLIAKELSSDFELK